MTRILKDCLGGNSIATFVTHFIKTQTNYEMYKAILDLTQDISKIQNYPTVNQDNCIGLLTRIRVIRFLEFFFKF